ncbi:MAG: GNAT superfamily N-acetyltransferase [Candidatus Paceibacteria bacterium]|jgi:GNAT superfamily N-acetyltransferase
MKLCVREDAGVALDLMERVLSPDAGLAAEYPLVFSPGSTGRVVVAEDAGEVCSACAILRRDLVFPDGLGRPRTVAAGLIGSVSTGETYRGKGLASSVLVLAEQRLMEEGCLFSMLWADSPDFYASRGYRPVGLENDFVLDLALCSVLPSTAATRPAALADYPALHQLYLRHSRRVDRSNVESAALFATPGMQIIVAEEAGLPVAYACRGRGHDLDGVIHEWAGSRDAALACIRRHLEAMRDGGGEGPLFLMCTVDELGLGSRLQELGASFASGVLGMAKLLNPQAAAKLLLDACDDALEVELSPQGAGSFKLGSRTVEVAPEQWLDLLLPACGNPEELESLERRLQTRFASLPWAPFLWGLDSI